jgi:hypothetical protein
VEGLVLASPVDPTEGFETLGELELGEALPPSVVEGVFFMFVEADCAFRESVL